MHAPRRSSTRLPVVAATLFLLVGLLPQAADARTRGMAPSALATLGGDAPEVTALADEPTEIVSAGSAGYIALAPRRIAGLTSLQPGYTKVQVAGVEGVPGEDVGAVVLNLAARNVSGASEITVWPAGAAQPSSPTLVVDASRDWTTIAVVKPGEGGAVTVRNRSGRLDLDVDVLGWFPAGAELFPVAPRRVFDSKVDPARKIRAGEVVTARVTGVAGVPLSGVASVVLSVTSSNSSGSSAITVWPTAEPRPDAPSLFTERLATRGNLVIVAPGQSGTVSLHNAAGTSHLAVDVLGWTPIEGTYHPMAPATLLDTAVDPGTPLAEGASVDVAVAGIAGIPGPDVVGSGAAYAAVLDLVASTGATGTAVTIFPAGEERPDTVSLAAGNGQPTVSLAIAELGADGKISIYNRGAATHLVVRVRGWFAAPAYDAELAVPDDVVVPEDQSVESAAIDPTNGATIVLGPGAAPVVPGDHLVLGVTDATPHGYMGTVTEVREEDGRQVVETAEALLDEVFPEGEVNANLEESETPAGQTFSFGESIVRPLAAVAPPSWSFELPEKEPPSCTYGGDPGVLKTTLGPTFDYTLRIHWSLFHAPEVTALATVGVEASVELNSLGVACSFTPDKEWWYRVKTFMVGPVPVVVSFSLSGTLDVKAGITGIHLGVSAGASATVGIRSNSPVHEGNTWFEYTKFDRYWVPASLRAYAMVDLWLDFSVRFYTLFGPKFSIGPFVEAFVTTDTREPWWAVDAGIAVKVVPSFRLLKWQKDFRGWQGEIPIAEWTLDKCSPYGPGLPGDAGYEVCWAVLHDPDTGDPVRADGNPREGLIDGYIGGRFRLLSAGKTITLSAHVPDVLPTASVGEPYPAAGEDPLLFTSEGLFASRVVWHVVAGLPPGLTLSTDSDGVGTLSGTPTEAGAYLLVVEPWYGPVADETSPPWGPYPPQRFELPIAVNGSGTINIVRDSDAELRAAIANVADGGTVSLLNDLTVHLTGGELVIPKDKTISIVSGVEGVGTSAAIDAGLASRVMRVGPGANATLAGITLANGKVWTGTDPAPYGGPRGGGAYVAAGATLVMRGGAVIRASRAIEGGGVYLDPAGAAGYEPAMLVMRADMWPGNPLPVPSIVEDNVARDAGGGVYSSLGNIDVRGGSIRDNTTGGRGGAGIFAAGGVVYLHRQYLTLPFPCTAGGVMLNVSTTTGGGIAIDAGIDKGAGARVTVDDWACVSNNAATLDGGGVYVYAGTLTTRGNGVLHENHSSEGHGGGIAVDAAATDATATLRIGGAGYDGHAVYSNQSALSGGGVYRPVGTTTFAAGSVAHNTPDDIVPSCAVRACAV